MWLKLLNGAVPVVATGTFGGPIEKQADFIKKVYDTGASAVIAITSLLADADEPDTVFNDRVFELFDQTEKYSFGFLRMPGAL
jgi:4-hydroxy-tetrahydrodipicolinate synthase